MTTTKRRRAAPAESDLAIDTVIDAIDLNHLSNL